MTISIVGLVLPVIASGCDPVSGVGCSFVTEPPIETELQCSYRVLAQDLSVYVPAIFQAHVEATCPIEKHGLMNLYQCQKCAEFHKPCQDQFAACEGCCGTSWHDVDNGPRFQVPSSHSCAELKEYYLAKNSQAVKCGNNTAEPIGHVNVTVHNHSSDEVWAEGVISDKCITDVHRLDCPSIPTKLRFRCDDCNIGSPNLLKKCCDTCMEFAEGPNVQQLFNESGVVAYVWCSGCDTDEVKMPEGYDPFPFVHKHLYSSRTEAQADVNMSNWVENNVCTQFEEKCETPSTTTTTTLTNRTTTTTTTTTNPNGVGWYILFESGGGASTFENIWSGYTSAGGWVHSGDGKRWLYDDMPIDNVKFTCDDVYGNQQWRTEFALSEQHKGKTLLDIVTGCVPVDKTNNGNSAWDAGVCRHVGSRSSYWCRNSCSLSSTSELRIAVGDGGADAHDWILFSFQSGSNGNFNGATYYGHGTEDVTSTVCNGNIQRIWGYGLPPVTTTLSTTTLTSSTSTTTVSTTSTTTECLDLCDIHERYGPSRRLPAFPRWLSDAADSDRHLSDSEGSYCEWDKEKRFDLTFYYPEKPRTVVQPPPLPKPHGRNDQEPNQLDPEVEELPVLVQVAVVELSGFSGSPSLPSIQAACAAAFADSWQADVDSLSLTIQYNEVAGIATVTVSATMEIARRLDVVSPVETKIRWWMSYPDYAQSGYHDGVQIWYQGMTAATQQTTSTTTTATSTTKHLRNPIGKDDTWNNQSAGHKDELSEEYEGTDISHCLQGAWSFGLSVAILNML